MIIGEVCTSNRDYRKRNNGAKGQRGREREREAHWNNSIRLFNQRQPIINRVTTGGYRGGGALSREKREAWKKKEEPADEVATGLINGTER